MSNECNGICHTYPEEDDLECEGEEDAEGLPVDGDLRGALELGRSCQSNHGHVTDESCQDRKTNHL